MAAKRVVFAVAASVCAAAASAGCGSPDQTSSGSSGSGQTAGSQNKADEKKTDQAKANPAKPGESKQGPKNTAPGKAGGQGPAKVITQAPEETATAPFVESNIPAAKGPAGDFPHLKADVAEPVKLVQQTLSDAKGLPIWVGDRLTVVNGTAHTRIYSAGRDGAAAQNAAMKHVDDLVAATGAQKVTHSRLSDAAADTISEWKELDKYSAGYGDVFNQPVTTYAVTVDGKRLWIQVCANNLQTSVLVVSAT